MTDSDLLEIRQAFAVESAELLAEMESALLVLESDSGSKDEFGRLFRTVHTIKGSASIVRFEVMEQFCHNIEHILVRIREHELSLDQRLVALLLQCHDHISVMLDRYCVSGDGGDVFVPPPLHALLLDRLREWAADSCAVQGEERVYGMLDDSYLNVETDANDSGFKFFADDAGDAQPVSGEIPEVFVNTIAPENEKNTRNQSVMRVDAARIDQLADLVVELVTASSVLESHVRKLGDLAAEESALHVADLIKQIQERTMSFRMVQVLSLFRRFHRIIHDVCNSSGKQITLLVNGGETELDKAVAEKLHEPLLHLVRNAIDHGVEPPGDRVACGKPPAGTIHLNAFHDAGNIVIRVGDDGAGINRENVARKAVERGLAKADSLAAGTEVLDYIFEPGFSTLDAASMLSGRGVGMDVVKKVVESLRGRIDVETAAGVGTTFQISIPLSLSLVDGFMVSLGDNLYILPMDLVLETLEFPSAAYRATMPNGCLQVRDRLLPCLDLRKLLGVADPAPAVQHVVVLRSGGTVVGLVVDSLHGEMKTVIKPLGSFYRNLKCISGSSILGDGSIALFLETGALIEASRSGA